MQPVQTWVTQYQKPDSGISLAGNILSSYLTGRQKQQEARDKKQLQGLTLLGNLMQLPKEERELFIPFMESLYDIPGVGGILGSESKDARFAREMKEQARGDIQGLFKPTTETVQPLLRQRDITTESRLSPQQGQSLFNLPQQQVPQAAMPQQIPSLPQPYAGGGSYAPIFTPSGAVGVPSSIPQVPPAPQQQPMLDFTRPLPPERQETITRQPGTAVTTTTPGMSKAEAMWRKPYTYKTSMGLQVTQEDASFEGMTKEDQDVFMARKFGTALTLYQEKQIKQGDLANAIAASENIMNATLKLMEYPEKVRNGLLPSINKMLENLELSGVEGISYISEEDLSGAGPEGLERARLKYKADLEASLTRLKNPPKQLTYKERAAQEIDIGESVYLAMIKAGATPEEARGAMWNAIQNPINGKVPGDAIEQAAASKSGWQGKPNSCALGVNNALKSVGIDVAKQYGINPAWAPDYTRVGYSVPRDQVRGGDLVFLYDTGTPPQYHMGIASKDGKSYYSVSSEEGYKWTLKPIPENAEFRRIDAVEPVQAQIDNWRAMTSEQRKAVILASKTPGADKLLGASEGKPELTADQKFNNIRDMNKDNASIITLAAQEQNNQFELTLANFKVNRVLFKAKNEGQKIYDLEFKSTKNAYNAKKKAQGKIDEILKNSNLGDLIEGVPTDFDTLITQTYDLTPPKKETLTGETLVKEYAPAYLDIYKENMSNIDSLKGVSKEMGKIPPPTYAADKGEAPVFDKTEEFFERSKAKGKQELMIQLKEIQNPYTRKMNEAVLKANGVDINRLEQLIIRELLPKEELRAR